MQRDPRSHVRAQPALAGRSSRGRAEVVKAQAGPGALAQLALDSLVKEQSDQPCQQDDQSKGKGGAGDDNQERGGVVRGSLVGRGMSDICERGWIRWRRTCLVMADQLIELVDDGDHERAVGTVAAAVGAADLPFPASALARDGTR